MSTTAKITDAAALSDRERKAALEALAPASSRTAPAELTPLDKIAAATMRPRDHFDGCPGEHGPTPTAKVEVYELRCPAPEPALINRGIETGGVAIVCRCMACAATVYHPSPLRPTIPAGTGEHTRAFLRSRLEGESDDLDTTLT
jgi:hypothetical protein